VFDYLLTSAASPREALDACGRYFRLLSDAHSPIVTLHRDRAVVHLETCVPIPRAVEDFALTTLVRNHVSSWHPEILAQTEVFYQHDVPFDLARYHDALGSARLHFSATQTGFSFPGRSSTSCFRRATFGYTACCAWRPTRCSPERQNARACSAE
jgi:hypothetical protein